MKEVYNLEARTVKTAQISCPFQKPVEASGYTLKGSNSDMFIILSLFSIGISS